MTTRPQRSGAADTRQRLLQTALALYAREGLHAVSLRQISAAAGSRNSAAMHYHFQDKLGVIKALVEMIAAELANLDRQYPLVISANDSIRGQLRQTIYNTLQPFARLHNAQPWGADAIRFVSHLLLENNSDISAITNPISEPFWQRIDAHLAALLPELPSPVRRLRLMFMSVNVLHGVAEAHTLAHTPLGDLSHFKSDALLEHLVDYLLGGLLATATEHSH